MNKSEIMILIFMCFIIAFLTIQMFAIKDIDYKINHFYNQINDYCTITIEKEA